MTYPDLEIIVAASCDAICAVADLVGHEGILSLLKYGSDLIALKNLNIDELKAEIAALNPEERLALEALAKSKFQNIPQPDVQAKLDSGVDLIEVVIQFAEQVYAQYQQGLALVNQVKALIGLS